MPHQTQAQQNLLALVLLAALLPQIAAAPQPGLQNLITVLLLLTLLPQFGPLLGTR